MNKLLSVWQLFKKGHVVTNAEMWKRGQITATVLGGVLIAVIQVLNAFGVTLPMNEDSATAIAGGIIAVVNWVITVISSDKVGLKENTRPNDQQVYQEEYRE